jgi:hypothetical protein
VPRLLGIDFGEDLWRRHRQVTQSHPVAARIALATAAIGGTIGTSTTPRTPNGWRGFGTSTITASIIGKSDATGTR